MTEMRVDTSPHSSFLYYTMEFDGRVVYWRRQPQRQSWWRWMPGSMRWELLR